MTNTILIIPVNQDSRPSSFSSAFETPDGVRVDVTIKTREKGVADAITAKVGALGWNQVPTTDPDMPLLAIPFVIAFALIVLGLFVFMGMGLLEMVGWLPRHNEFLGDYETTSYVMKWFGRAAIIAWIPLSIVAMLAEYGGRKAK